MVLTRQPTVLVVDLSPGRNAWSGLRDFLCDGGYAAGLVSEPDRVVERILAQPADALLLSLEGLAPDASRDLVVHLREHTSAAMLVLHASGDHDRALELLERGADDFLCRDVLCDGDAALRELRARLDVALRTRLGDAGGRWIVLGDTRYDREQRRLERAGRRIHLPPAEAALFHTLVHRIDEVVPYRDLAEALDPDGRVTRESLRTHVARLRRRLGWPSGRTEAPTLRSARGHGYELRVAPEPAAAEDAA